MVFQYNFDHLYMDFQYESGVRIYHLHHRTPTLGDMRSQPNLRYETGQRGFQQFFRMNDQILGEFLRMGHMGEELGNLYGLEASDIDFTLFRITSGARIKDHGLEICTLDDIRSQSNLRYERFLWETVPDKGGFQQFYRINEHIFDRHI